MIKYKYLPGAYPISIMKNREALSVRLTCLCPFTSEIGIPSELDTYTCRRLNDTIGRHRMLHPNELIFEVVDKLRTVSWV